MKANEVFDTILAGFEYFVDEFIEDLWNVSDDMIGNTIVKKISDDGEGNIKVSMEFDIDPFEYSEHDDYFDGVYTVYLEGTGSVDKDERDFIFDWDEPYLCKINGELYTGENQDAILGLMGHIIGEGFAPGWMYGYEDSEDDED